jgi:hypothetical protein
METEQKIRAKALKEAVKFAKKKMFSRWEVMEVADKFTNYIKTGEIKK